MKTLHWFGLSAVLAFIAFISIANMDSAFADEHNANDAFLITGIVSIIASAFSMYKAHRSSQS